ncbi:hypothetical protein C8T65DRAFT_204275 [Cerioporus squamosus]|nr:hypothetical protein C8T65DRAFT_204275 [Cerioporus squamosus]
MPPSRSSLHVTTSLLPPAGGAPFTLAKSAAAGVGKKRREASSPGSFSLILVYDFAMIHLSICLFYDSWTDDDFISLQTATIVLGLLLPLEFVYVRADVLVSSG